MRITFFLPCIPSLVGRCVLSVVSTCFRFFAESNLLISFNSAALSGNSSGRSSSLRVCGVGVGFFSSVSTCFSFDLSNDLTSALESAFSSSMTNENKIKIMLTNLPL